MLGKRSTGGPHNLRLHARLEQKHVPLLNEVAQLSSRLNSLHPHKGLLDRTPGMDQTFRSLELRKIDLSIIIIDSTDVGMTLLTK